MSSPQGEAIELEGDLDSKPLTGERDLKRYPSASNYADMEDEVLHHSNTMDSSLRSKLQPYLIYFFIVPIILLFFVMLIVIIVVFLYKVNTHEQTPENPTITNTTCRPPPIFENPFNSNLKRFPFESSPLLLKSVKIFDGETFSNQNLDIFMKSGVIEKIKPSIEVTIAEEAGYKVIRQYQNYIVTPGLIDMHSHLGVYSLPGDVNANSDGNELTDPTLPMVCATFIFTVSLLTFN